MLEHHRFSKSFRSLCSCLCFIFTLTFALPPTPGDAQMITQAFVGLPVPGTMIGPSIEFTPPLVRGLTIHPENPFEFDFIIDTGDRDLKGESFEKESKKLIKYFLASLTVPDDEFWVNLSPEEKDRIVGNGLGETQMGLDMLAQDYLLKQLTATLMYPEKELGRKFWKRVYQQVKTKYGSVNIPMDNFHKVWIVPDGAGVYENDGSAFVVERHLKVMLEEDYLSREASLVNRETTNNDSRDTIDEIIREVIIPEIEHEVNHGKNFAKLRQIYNSMILATWYKQALKDSLLSQVYVNQNKVKGIDIEDKTAPEKVYAQYIEAFTKGVYNYIKEEVDPITNQIVPKQYFSGGITRIENLTVSSGDLKDQSMSVKEAVLNPESKGGRDQNVTWRADTYTNAVQSVERGVDADQAMLSNVHYEVYGENGTLLKKEISDFDTYIKDIWAQKYRAGIFDNDVDRIEKKKKGIYTISLNNDKPMSPVSEDRKKQSDVVKKDFDPELFNFNRDSTIPQRIAELDIDGSKARIQINYGPNYRNHFLVLPEAEDNNPQLIQIRHILTIQKLFQLSSENNLKFGHNSWGAGAAVNHLHIHGIYHPEGGFALESARTAEFVNVDGVSISEIIDYAAKGFVFESENIDALSVRSGGFIENLQDRNIPYNLLMSRNKIYVLPRSFGISEVDGVEFVFGFMEMVGDIGLSKAMFEKLKDMEVSEVESILSNALEQSTVSEETYNILKQNINNHAMLGNAEQSVERGVESVDSDQAMLGTPKTIKILFADTPAGSETIDNVRAALESELPEGTIVKILIDHTGVGKDPIALQKIMEQEKPDIVMVRSATTAFTDVDILNNAKTNNVKAIIHMGVDFTNINTTEAANRIGISVIRTHGSANSVANMAMFFTAALPHLKGSQIEALVDLDIKKGDVTEIFTSEMLDEYGVLTAKSKKMPKAASAEIISSIQELLGDHLNKKAIDPIKDVGVIESLAAALEGKTVALLGFKGIAQAYAKKLEAVKKLTGVEFDIIAHSRSLKEGDPRLEELNVTPVTRDELIKRADILSLHIPGVTGLNITTEELKSSNVELIINTARSSLVADDVLRPFLEVGGFYVGDFDMTDDLVKLVKDFPNQVLVTPHIAASTKDGASGVEEMTIPTTVRTAKLILGLETENPEIVNGVIPAVKDQAMLGDVDLVFAGAAVITGFLFARNFPSSSKNNSYKKWTPALIMLLITGVLGWNEFFNSPTSQDSKIDSIPGKNTNSKVVLEVAEEKTVEAAEEEVEEVAVEETTEEVAVEEVAVEEVAKDIDAIDKNGMTALMAAVTGGQIDAVKVLIENSADVNVKNHYGLTALMFASGIDNYDVVKVLIENSADVSLQNVKGMTALDIAKLLKNTEIIKLLKSAEAEADIDAIDKNGMTALMRAVTGGQIDAVKVLIENGADVNVKNHYGLTALMVAVGIDNYDAVKVLIENGADVNLQSVKGITALDMEELLKNTEIIKLLKSAGAKTGAELKEKNKSFIQKHVPVESSSLESDHTAPTAAQENQASKSSEHYKGYILKRYPSGKVENMSSIPIMVTTARPILSDEERALLKSGKSVTTSNYEIESHDLFDPTITYELGDEYLREVAAIYQNNNYVAIVRPFGWRAKGVTGQDLRLAHRYTDLIKNQLESNGLVSAPDGNFGLILQKTNGEKVVFYPSSKYDWILLSKDARKMGIKVGHPLFVELKANALENLLNEIERGGLTYGHEINELERIFRERKAIESKWIKKVAEFSENGDQTMLVNAAEMLSVIGFNLLGGTLAYGVDRFLTGTRVWSPMGILSSSSSSYMFSLFIIPPIVLNRTVGNDAAFFYVIGSVLSLSIGRGIGAISAMAYNNPRVKKMIIKKLEKLNEIKLLQSLIALSYEENSDFIIEKLWKIKEGLNQEMENADQSRDFKKYNLLSDILFLLGSRDGEYEYIFKAEEGRWVLEGRDYEIADLLKRDDAILAEKQDADDVGGIDFNPQGLDLKIKRDGNGIPLPLPQQPLEIINIEGLIPVIINIVPIHVPMMLGLRENEDVELSKGRWQFLDHGQLQARRISHDGVILGLKEEDDEIQLTALN